MKKRIFLIIFCATLCIQSIHKIIAQSTISEGPVFPVEKKIGFQKIIGADDSGFYMMKQSSVGDGIHIIIEKYNKENFNLIFSKETKVAEIQESMNFAPVTVIQTFFSNEKVFVFFESYNKKLKKLLFFLQTVNTAGDVSEPYEVSSSYLEFEQPFQIMGRMFFKVAFSPDQKLFSVVPILGEDEKAKTTFCRLYNTSTFEKIWEKPIPIKDRGEKIQTDNFTIDNSGNLLFTIKYIITENKEDAKSITGGFAMGIIETTSPTVKVVDIDFPEKKVIHDYTIKTLTNGDMILCGIISDTLAKGTRSGFTNPSYFIKRIESNTLATKYEVFDDFSLDAKKQLGESKRGDTFTNTEVIEMNGNAYIVSQLTQIMLKLESFGKTVFVAANSTNKELVVAKITNDGKIAWNIVIPKLHLGSSLKEDAQKPPRYSGNYKTFVLNNKLNFVFADHPENAELKTNNYSIENLKPIHGSLFGSETLNAKDKASANAVCVSIDEKGASTKNVFFQNTEGGVSYVAIGNTVLLTPKKLLIFLENRKTKIEKFATLNFD